MAGEESTRSREIHNAPVEYYIEIRQDDMGSGVRGAKGRKTNTHEGNWQRDRAAAPQHALQQDRLSPRGFPAFLKLRPPHNQVKAQSRWTSLG